MKVIPEKLMARLGSVMFRGKETRWSCPLHQDADGCMTATDAPMPFFSCESPVCRFGGDAVSLVSLARNISVMEAVALFRKGGELACCLADELSDAEADAYVDAANSRAVLHAYLSKCRQALRKCPERAGIHVGMSVNNLRLLHPDVGLFVASDDVPRCLREFVKPKYRRSNLILYPFTRDGDVTRIEVVDPANPGFRHTVVVTHPTAGVFGERFVGASRKLILAEDPETAATLFAMCAAASAGKFTVVSFRDYPLPNSFKDVSNIEVLTFSGKPVSTEFLLRTLSAPSVKSSGSGRSFEMRVVDCGRDVSSVPASSIPSGSVRGGKDVYAYDIQYLVAKRFTEMVAQDKGQEVLGLVGKCQSPSFIKNLLKDAASTQIGIRGGFNHDKASTLGLISLLEEARCETSCDIELANGKVIRCTPDGIFAVRVTGNVDLLCNVGVSVNSRITAPRESKRKYEAFDCTVYARGDFPARRVRFMWDDLTTERMRTVVQQAYSDTGMSPYVAFYGSGGFSWKDIMSKLAENCPVDKEELEEGVYMKGPPLELSKPVSGGSVAIGPVS